jgi:glycolate oxidase
MLTSGLFFVEHEVATNSKGEVVAMASPAVDLDRKPARPSADFTTLQEIAITAQRNLSRMLWDTLCGGSDSEATLRRNRLALDSLTLRQRVLVNVADMDTSATLLGEKLPIPVFIAPVGNFLQLADPEGAVAVARGAVAYGTTAFISTAARPGIEEVAKSVDKPLLFQLYVRSDRSWCEDILLRAKAAGYRAICVTVDRAYYSRRERDVMNRYMLRESAGDPRFQASLTWDDVAWMKELTQLPLILKGIATGEDAELAVKHGADVIYVSNHGGRQLDHGQATIETLPEVVDAVAGRAEVIWDGGVMRGTDVIKALALGATSVGVGKLQGLALAAAGEAGIRRMLELLEIEIRSTMGLMGITSVSQLDRSWVRAAPPITDGSLSGPYPRFRESYAGNE